MKITQFLLWWIPRCLWVKDTALIFKEGFIIQLGGHKMKLWWNAVHAEFWLVWIIRASRTFRKRHWLTEGIYSGQEMCATSVSALGGFWSDGSRCHSFGLITESQVSQMVQWVKKSAWNAGGLQETLVSSLGREDPWGRATAVFSSGESNGQRSLAENTP